MRIGDSNNVWSLYAHTGHPHHHFRTDVLPLALPYQAQDLADLASRRVFLAGGMAFIRLTTSQFHDKQRVGRNVVSRLSEGTSDQPLPLKIASASGPPPFGRPSWTVEQSLCCRSDQFSASILAGSKQVEELSLQTRMAFYYGP